MYVLLGGRSAIYALATKTGVEAKRLYDKLGGKRVVAGLRAIQFYEQLSQRSRTRNRRKKTPRPLEMAVLTDRVARLMNKRVRNSGRTARLVYRRAYSAESYAATHTNLETLNAYGIRNGDVWSVLPKPSPGVRPIETLLIAADLTAILAVDLFDAFGKSPVPFMKAHADVGAARTGRER